jgi:hypothetical protein
VDKLSYNLDLKLLESLPETGFLRLPQIIGKPKATPPIPPLIPVSKSTWWEGVRTGRFPKPIKFGARMAVWRVEDIKAFIEKGGM